MSILYPDPPIPSGQAPQEWIVFGKHRDRSDLISEMASLLLLDPVKDIYQTLQASRHGPQLCENQEGVMCARAHCERCPFS